MKSSAALGQQSETGLLLSWATISIPKRKAVGQHRRATRTYHLALFLQPPRSRSPESLPRRASICSVACRSLCELFSSKSFEHVGPCLRTGRSCPVQVTSRHNSIDYRALHRSIVTTSMHARYNCKARVHAAVDCDTCQSMSSRLGLRDAQLRIFPVRGPRRSRSSE